MSIAMVGDGLTNNHSKVGASRYVRRSQRNIPEAQQIIYDHLLYAVKNWPVEEVLDEFKHLFIHHANTSSSDILPALYEIVFANNEKEFRHTLKRSCYILINNWDISRDHEAIQKLIQLFSDRIIYRHTQSPTLRRLREWLKDFVHGKDFEELKLFASRYDVNEPTHWSQRYTSYLLVPQYINQENSVEQREAARALSRKLKERFKLDLAFYTVLSESVRIPQVDVKNPTFLGDESLRLIKAVVARRGLFSYANLANIFLKQIQNINYKLFKESLKEYLIYALEDNDFVKTFETQIDERLNQLYTVHEDKKINDALLLRTANRVVEYLTTEDHESPSPLFLMLLSHGNPLTLVIILLKIVLMCPHVRTHLEARIADLIRYYEKYSEEDCKWVVNFFEIFNITMTIHAESTEYTLVSMADSTGEESEMRGKGRSLDEYRVFSQTRLLSDFTADSNQDLDDIILSMIEEDEPEKASSPNAHSSDDAGKELET